jgi:hypothetical protein
MNLGFDHAGPRASAVADCRLLRLIGCKEVVRSCRKWIVLYSRRDVIARDGKKVIIRIPTQRFIDRKHPI